MNKKRWNSVSYYKIMNLETNWFIVEYADDLWICA